MSNITREQWLKRMAKHLSREFKRQFYTVPENIRVSCGLPSSRAFGAKRKTIGQCWDKAASDDKHFEIFVSPTVDDPIEVAATLAHEMVHAVVGLKAGHKKPFVDCARSIGLEGKPTATVAGLRLKEFIIAGLEKIGQYPHAKIDYSSKKKQGTRLVKVACPNQECDFLEELGKVYSVRMSAQVIEYGLPACGCCQETMVEV